MIEKPNNIESEVDNINDFTLPFKESFPFDEDSDDDVIDHFYRYRSKDQTLSKTKISCHRKKWNTTHMSPKNDALLYDPNLQNEKDEFRDDCGFLNTPDVMELRGLDSYPSPQILEKEGARCTRNTQEVKRCPIHQNKRMIKPIRSSILVDDDKILHLPETRDKDYSNDHNGSMCEDNIKKINTLIHHPIAITENRSRRHMERNILEVNNERETNYLESRKKVNSHYTSLVTEHSDHQPTLKVVLQDDNAWKTDCHILSSDSELNRPDHYDDNETISLLQEFNSQKLSATYYQLQINDIDDYDCEVPFDNIGILEGESILPKENENTNQMQIEENLPPLKSKSQNRVHKSEENEHEEDLSVGESPNTELHHNEQVIKIHQTDDKFQYQDSDIETFCNKDGTVELVLLNEAKNHHFFDKSSPNHGGNPDQTLELDTTNRCNSDLEYYSDSYDSYDTNDDFLQGDCHCDSLLWDINKSKIPDYPAIKHEPRKGMTPPKGILKFKNRY